jgi:hypothetical protein
MGSVLLQALVLLAGAIVLSLPSAARAADVGMGCTLNAGGSGCWRRAAVVTAHTCILDLLF